MLDNAMPLEHMAVTKFKLFSFKFESTIFQVDIAFILPSLLLRVNWILITSLI